MPPKPQKGRSAKSSKLSKAEKEKLKKEEAERKAKEEEEARLKEEQEKREQEEREQLEREERQKLWEAEKARHQAELDEVNEILDNNMQQLKSLEEAQRSKSKWERYMLCDGSPDPMIENELNTFMHLWRDEPVPKSSRDVLEECESTLKLISELEFHIHDSEQEQLTEDELMRYKESVRKLQDLIGFKLDRATMELLLTASDNVDPESQNLEYITSTEHITLCLWGNTAKNPRLKSVSFEKQGFAIEVPKSLAVGDVSIRILLTAYDHLSPQAKSFYPKQKKLPEVVVEPVQETEEEKKEDGEEEQKVDEEEQHNTITPKSASVVSRGSKGSKAKSGRTGSSKSNRSRKASAKSAKSQSSEQTSQKEPEPEQEQTDDAATKTDQSGEEVPPEIANIDELEEDDDDEDDDDVVDLRAFGVVGPTIFLELLELPPQPKHVKTWTIQQIVSPDLKRLPYQNQTDGVPGSASSNGPHPASASNTQVQAIPPLVINMKLPGNVMYFEQPQLAWWEPTKKQWRMDGLADITYNDEERTMSFKTMGFGPIATTQDLYLNMPFQSWEIRPHSTNSCVFTLIAAIIEMEIEIKDGLCCLGQPDDIEELSHLIGKWMKPKNLMQALKGAGVNVFPAEDADKYVSINKKDEKLEKDVYQEISLTASAFAYSWSKWNAESGEDKIVLQTTEQLQDEMLLEEDWSLYLLTTKSSCQLRMKEEDSEFTDNAADNTQLHSNLYHMLKDGASQDAQKRIQESSFLFVDCVYQLLSATKVVTYS